MNMLNRESYPTCHSLRLLADRRRQHACVHPRVHVPDQLVTPTFCELCGFRDAIAPASFRPMPRLASRSWPPTTVAVVIPCHNYGRYLREALESVLNQTYPPDEIIVVDDGSTDDTPQVATEYADRDVSYLRVEYGHSQRTRRAGFLATSADVLCFLDADDRLAPDYLELGLREFADHGIGIVYSDVEHFGTKRNRSQYSEYSRDELSRMNYMHSGSLVLREALEVSQGLDIETDDKYALQDWLLWRRILDCGWKARKQAGLYHYRKHGQSMTADWQAWHSNSTEYFLRAALAQETVTLFIPLSGRISLWPGLAEYLSRQTWPHDQIRLILFDTSQSAEFSRAVREWVSTCDYADVRHIRQAVGEPGLADWPRREVAREVTLIMARIYNRLAREVNTDYAWVLEDDVLPPLDACERLLRGFDRCTASVSACYWSRFARAYVAWMPNQKMISENPGGLREVGGNGFGCVVLRSEVVRREPFTASVDFPAYDNAFYHRLPATGLRAKLDWSVECEHRILDLDTVTPSTF